MPTAYSYTRFSTPEQRKGTSFQRQTQMAREFAVRHKLTLDETLKMHDDGVSAFHGHNATVESKLGAFLESVHSGEVAKGSYLLVERLDRLSRQNPADATEVVREIIKAGITVVPLSSGTEYSWPAVKADPFLWMRLQFDLLQGHMESAKKSDRLKATWAIKRDAARATGKPLTTICPPWLKWDADTKSWQLDQERTAIVRRIYTDTLYGQGQHSITEALNLEGVKPFGLHGTVWRRPYVRTLLATKAVIGTYTPKVSLYNDDAPQRRIRVPQEELEDYFPAIIDKEDFGRVQELLRDRGAPLRGKHAAGKVRNLFGHLARCAACDAVMVLTSGNPYSHYVCETARVRAGCERRTVRLDVVESRFLEEADHLLRTAPAGANGKKLDRTIANLEANLASLQDRFDDLREELRRGFSSAIAQSIRETEAEGRDYRAQLEALISERDETSGPLVKRKIADLLTALKAKELDRAHINALLRQLFTVVRVDCPDDGAVRFTFVWKHGGESIADLAWRHIRTPLTGEERRVHRNAMQRAARARQRKLNEKPKKKQR